MANYHQIYECDLSNGEGCRLTLFFSGCNHGCKGCWNPETWNPNSGKEITNEVIKEFLEKAAYHDGISLSGGDPLHPRNRSTVLRIVTDFRAMYPGKDIWLWTGYRFEDIISDPDCAAIIPAVDFIIDGKYEQDSPTLKPWRGSDNQRKINIKTMYID